SDTATITDSNFLSNSASNRGGGVLVNAGTVTINDSVFSANIGGDGAGIYSVADAFINHTTFNGNRASLRGGGLMGEDGNVKVDGSTFSNNYAEFSGGAGIVLDPGKMNFTNSTFTGNMAAQYKGGALFLDALGSILVNDTFLKNSAALNGGSIYIYESDLATIIENVIVAQSTPENCFLGLNFNSLVWPSNNLSDDATCDGFTHVKSLVPPKPLNLGPLADNGGSTKTLAVNSPSPALDNASAACFNPLTSGGGGGVDQRGFTRSINALGAVNFPQVGDCDTGAFEAGGVVRTLQFMFPSSSVANGSSMPINIPLKLNSVQAQAQVVTGYVWVSGGTAVVGQDYAPFGVQAVTITPGMTTTNATIMPLNPSASSDKTIILSFATQHGPGFSGAARLGTQLTHTVTLKANGAPNRNYYTTNTPTLTWNRVSQAFRYEIQAAGNSLFADAIVYDAGNNLLFMWPVALPNGPYYWRVRACTGAAESSCGAWSAYDTFTVFVS
ncbi:MAG: right-handed parallel beta-helix repeat-containing protein, partial [Anaerolineae bacterium]|nr:right-handed parallel beta-helix repeat-containing protein [Anaerolineae bacterium]